MNATRRLYVIILVLFVVLVIMALVFFISVRRSSEPEVEEIERTSVPEEVISGTINQFDPDDPKSFEEIQIIVDQGEAAVDPLLELSKSDDLLEQWTAVVALTSIRRSLSDQENITSAVKDMYLSEEESIRIYAAMSNAEQKDYSGIPILLKGLNSEKIMIYMDPPQPIDTFSNKVLEFVSGQECGYQEVMDRDQFESLTSCWNDWWQGINQQNL